MQEKWPAGSVSEPLMHSAQSIFKVMTKFMFIQMTNFNCNLGNNLTPAGSSIYFKLKKSFNIDFKSLIFSAFLREYLIYTIQ